MAIPAKSGKDTMEYQVINRNHATIVDSLGRTVGDPYLFAMRLREKSLISDGELEVFTLSMGTLPC